MNLWVHGPAAQRFGTSVVVMDTAGASSYEIAAERHGGLCGGLFDLEGGGSRSRRRGRSSG
jgi:hypothetical protein